MPRREAAARLGRVLPIRPAVSPASRVPGRSRLTLTRASRTTKNHGDKGEGKGKMSKEEMRRAEAQSRTRRRAGRH